jgi:hypothetical protein
LTQAATNLSQDEMDEQASESATAQIIQLPNVLDYIE